MLDKLSIPFEEYYNSLQGVKNRNFPIEQLEKMKDYLIEKYEKNMFVVYEDLALLVLNRKDENKLRIASKETERIMKELGLYNPLLKNNAIIGEYVKTIMNGLQKLIDGLKKNEEEFYKEVLNSGNPNFLITSYYSLYLRFVTTVYLKLRKIAIPNPNIKTKDSTIKDTFTISNFLVGFFGIPILIYMKKKEVLPYISELSGILLHVLVVNRTPIPSKDSLGYYLFAKIHADSS